MMVFEACLPGSLVLDRTLSPAIKELYALISLRQANGTVPIQAEMARDLGVNCSIIRRRLGELHESGWLLGREGARGRYLLVADSPPEEEGWSLPSLSEQHRAMLQEVAEVCNVDLGLATRAVRGQADQVARYLRESGFLPGDVIEFGRWWREADWRGQTGSPPIPSQVRSEWGKALSWLDEEAQGVADLPEFR